MFKNTHKIDLAKAKVMFEKESLIMDLCQDHPNILTGVTHNSEGFICSGSSEARTIYNVTEYVENGTLEVFLKYTGPIEESLSMLYFAQIVGALKFMHDHNLVHLDLKPSNLLFDKHFNIKVGDLGSAEILKRDGMTTRRKGTKGYMAPEVSDFYEITPFNAKKADVYSLGVVLYVMLCGSIPYLGKEETTWSTDLEEDLTGIDSDYEDVSKSQTYSHISKQTQKLIEAMLSDDPEVRPNIDEI